MKKKLLLVGIGVIGLALCAKHCARTCCARSTRPAT
jgi:hypothetical protein